MYDAIPQFRDAIRATGLEPPNVIEPGKFHRFPGIGKGARNRAGWCLLFDDCRGGCFGDWSTDLYKVWQAKRGQPCSHAERSALARQVKAARQRAEAERLAEHDAAAKRADIIWNTAAYAPNDHPYLLSKCIQPHGAKLHKNTLVLPIVDFTGKLTSLQFIAADGGKKLLSGGRKQGCFIPVTDVTTAPSHVVICEGWATGCTLAEDDPSALVLAAIDAGNLKPVATAARCQWPSAELVIAGDDDRLTRGNPGATKATSAAIASGALLALPPWPENAPDYLTDFNDLAVWLAGGGA